LPTGLAIAAGTGVISGTPTVAGTFNVTATVSDGRGGSASRSFVWTVTAAARGAVRYVRLGADSEVNGNPWTSMAEFNLLEREWCGDLSHRLGGERRQCRAGGENAPPSSAIDGYASTFWHTQWKDASRRCLHAFTVDSARRAWCAASSTCRARPGPTE